MSKNDDPQVYKPIKAREFSEEFGVDVPRREWVRSAITRYREGFPPIDCYVPDGELCPVGFDPERDGIVV